MDGSQKCICAWRGEVRSDEVGPESRMRRETILSRIEGTRIGKRDGPNRELWKTKHIKDTELGEAKRRELCTAEKKQQLQ